MAAFSSFAYLCIYNIVACLLQQYVYIYIVRYSWFVPLFSYQFLLVRCGYGSVLYISLFSLLSINLSTIKSFFLPYFYAIYYLTKFILLLSDLESGMVLLPFSALFSFSSLYIYSSYLSLLYLYSFS